MPAARRSPYEVTLTLEAPERGQVIQRTGVKAIKARTPERAAQLLLEAIERDES